MEYGTFQLCKPRNYGKACLLRTWYVWEDFDEKVAYELVKTAAENAPSFKEYFAGGKAANLETFVANAWKESRYHPGALKFYKEKGIIPKGTL